MMQTATVTRLKFANRRSVSKTKLLEEPIPEFKYWVIEACETPTNKPSFLVGISKGRCFFLWHDNILLSKKFQSELHAHRWARDNRLLCGFRVTVKSKTQQTRRF